MTFIYLDHFATTPLSSVARTRMLDTYDRHFANPASTSHNGGIAADAYLSQCRAEVATAIEANSRQIIFTSGATESNNTIFNAMLGVKAKNPFHVVVSAFEHKCVLESAKRLERSGVDVTYVEPERSGVVSVDKVVASVRDDTRLVSVMLVNNELGTIQPVDKIAASLKNRQLIVHTDASQALGKVPISFRRLGIHAMSLSAHKAYGPKGVGCLVITNPNFIQRHPILCGGSQESGARAGTVNLPGVAGFASATTECVRLLEEENKRLHELRAILLRRFEHSSVAWSLNAEPTDCVSGALSIRLHDVPANRLLGFVGDRIALSSGSACSSNDQKMSHVLRSIRMTEEEARGCIRISLGRTNSIEDVEVAAEILLNAVKSLNRKAA